MPDNWKEAFDHAAALLESGNVQDALQAFAALPRQEAHQSLVQYSIAVCHARLGRLPEAVRLLEQVRDSGNPLPGALALLQQLQALPSAETAASPQKLRFLCVQDLPADSIPLLDKRCDEAGASRYIDRLQIIRQDGVNASRMHPFYLPPEAWDSQLLFFSHERLQEQWWREFGTGPLPGSRLEVLQRQIEIIRPDVLYLGEPVAPLDSGFLGKLQYQPRIVCGWRNTPFPRQTDWSRFDIILGDSPEILEAAKKHGARNVVSMQPAFPRWLGEKYQEIRPQKDVLFCGQADSERHARRNRYWELLAGEATKPGADFQFTFRAEKAPGQSPALQELLQPLLRGAELHEEMRGHRMILNAYGDLPPASGINDRLLEGLGLGCFVLNEYLPGIEKFFEPDKELVCFRTPEELLEKVRYYLTHEEERIAIARCGREKVLAAHALEDHSRVFSNFLISALQQKEAALAAARASQPAQPSTAVAAATAAAPQAGQPPVAQDVYDQAYLWGWSRPEHREKVFLCYKTPDHAQNAHRFAASPEFQEELRLLASLGKPARREIKVLDFGCGNGIASYALAKAGYDVTAMDSSTGEIAGINAARKLVGLDGVNFTILHSTGESIPFPDASFDIVWMREALHHMHDLPDFVRGIRRILKPGGVLCCLRDPTIFNEDQRQFLFATHPFYHITHDEGCYYLQEYLEGFRHGGMELRVLLSPVASVINTYPGPFVPGRTFDDKAAARNKQIIYLFSFFAVKPLAAPAAEEPPQAAEAPRASAAQHPAFPRVTFGQGVQITGVAEVAIGEGSCIGDNCWINANARDRRKHLRIGRCVLIGRQSVISVNDDLEIGDFTCTGAGVLVSESFHSQQNILLPYLVQRIGSKGRLVIEENCWLYGNATVFGGLTVGRGSVIGAHTVVTGDVPPFSMVLGNPHKIVQMFNPQAKQWEHVRSDADRERIEQARRVCPLPGREEYRELLWKNSPVKAIDPLCAGRGVWV